MQTEDVLGYEVEGDRRGERLADAPAQLPMVGAHRDARAVRETNSETERRAVRQNHPQGCSGEAVFDLDAVEAVLQPRAEFILVRFSGAACG